MRKKVLLGLLVITTLFSITGCTLFKEKRTIEYLLDEYAEAYTTENLEKAKDMFPEYYLKYNEKNVNQESLNKELENAKKTYGDDFNITYSVKEEIKFTDEELKNLNDKIKNTYKSEDQATECYKYDGTITLKGSKKTDELTLSTIGRCKINDTWYLLRK